MSLPATRPASAVLQTLPRDNVDTRSTARPRLFTRDAGASDEISRTAPARHALAAGPTPFKPVAHAICAASAGLQQKLENRGAANSAYLGTDGGSSVYRNKETGEVAIQHMILHSGPERMNDFGNLCQVKPDGRIIFNGRDVTENHPDRTRIQHALDRLFQKVAADKLPRDKTLAGIMPPPPWHPGSSSHPDYVA